MTDSTERRKRLVLFISLVLLAIALMAAKSRPASPTAVFDSLVQSSVMPLQTALADSTHWLHNLWHSYLHLTQVHQDNLQLRQQVTILQGQLHHYHTAYLQQQRLQQLLDFRSLTFPTAAVAKVVSIDPSPWSESITINKGSEHGLHKHNAVVTHQGLVGHTIETTARHATVLLLTDRRSAVDALVQRTRARGVVVGKSEQLLELRYAERHDDIQVGDRIVSSGIGMLYPKGLLIGTVTVIRPQRYGLFHDIDVEPAVDFVKLEEVLALEP